MYEGGRAERMIRALGTELTLRQTVQLLVQQREQTVQAIPATGAETGKDSGDFAILQTNLLAAGQ